MDMRDKQFDNWIQDTLEFEITATKQNKQAAWEQLRMKASRSSNSVFAPVNDLAEIVCLPVKVEPLPNRIWQLFVCFRPYGH